MHQKENCNACLNVANHTLQLKGGEVYLCCKCLESLIAGFVPPKFCTHLYKIHCLKLFCCECIELAIY